MARELCEDKSSDMVTSTGYYYSDNSEIQTQFTNQIPAGFGPNPGEIFNLTTENMMGFSKNLHHHAAAGPSSLKTANESTADFYHHELCKTAAFTAATWAAQENRFELVDDSSLRCVFPCEGNERPSQGLSLSLSSSNPSSIGLQSFELRQQTNHDHSLHELQQQEDGFLGKAANNLHDQEAAVFLLRSSRYLAPAQELLYEFCNLGIMNKKQNDSSKQWKLKDDVNGGCSSSKQAAADLQSLDFMELQKRKTRLYSMLEELERRYRRYCDQMKAVVSSFEAVAGSGAAAAYSALASKAMSRHFRCLKDGLAAQIQATRKAMGEKDPVAPGTTRGETPRLRAIDQALRQQRTFQQMSLMESHPWRPQRGLPERSVSVLRAWLFEHFLHPYPSDVDKHILARQTGLSRSQVSNWFINARVRLWKPMVEEMYTEETKELDDDNDNNNNSDVGLADINGRRNQNHRIEDQKPTPDQLLRIDSDCLSSIITSSEKNDSRATKTMQNQLHSLSFGRVAAETFGTVELDFSSYNHGGGGDQNLNGGVSLTLGLQQHAGENGGNIAAVAGFYGREQMEECQPVQYSLLEGESQNLPYRNLMGAQLLHDLAG